MKTAATGAQILVGLTGLINLVSGVLFWTHNALTLIPIHMQVGFVFVLSLWALAVLAAQAGVNPAFVWLVLAWGVLVLALGMTQARLLVGDAHCVIQVLHLLVGLVGMGLAGGLGARIRHAGAQVLQP